MFKFIKFAGFCLVTVFAANAFAAEDQATTKAVAEPVKIVAEKVAKKTAKVIELVNVNTADEAMLAKIKCIGKKKAAAIIKYRQEHGDFHSVDDLANVEGFNPRALKRASKHLTI